MNPETSSEAGNLGQPSAGQPARPGSSPWQQALSNAALQTLVSVLQWGTETVGRTTPLRQAIVGNYDRRLRAQYQRMMETSDMPPVAVAQRMNMALAILHTMDRAMAQNLLGAATMRGVLNIITREILMPQSSSEPKRRFQAQYGAFPPAILAISPGKACNLRCAGCYADSGPSRAKLEWPVLSRIVWEARNLWGVHFFIISGGEPLAYRDQGKGVMDLAEANRDCFFMMYTNGTLIDERMARRMGAVGNITPAISVEGMQERTDARRGPGIFDQVLQAMGRLRRERVPFGISMTATRENHADLLSDTVMDFYFEQMGALYGWLFHYMPIGRAITLEMMPTAEQRVALLQRMWELIGQRYYFLADFWNSGTLADGCIAAGGRMGYLYVDWNGAVSPCVFVPYSPVNIHTVYDRNKTLNDVWEEPFFASIRSWQQTYNPGLGAPGQHPDGNLLMPCIYRDHHADFMRLAREHEPDPTDENSRAALLDPAYHEGMEQFDRELAALTDPLWQARYVPSKDSPNPPRSGGGD